MKGRGVRGSGPSMMRGTGVFDSLAVMDKKLQEESQA
jgi:hypothetical protein